MIVINGSMYIIRYLVKALKCFLPISILIGFHTVIHSHCLRGLGHSLSSTAGPSYPKNPYDTRPPHLSIQTLHAHYLFSRIPIALLFPSSAAFFKSATCPFFPNSFLLKDISR